MLVHIVIGKHEVKAVPDIFFAEVIPDGGSGDKLKIDTVAVSGDIIIFDQGVSAFPEMDTVTGQLFRFWCALDLIIPDGDK